MPNRLRLICNCLPSSLSASRAEHIWAGILKTLSELSDISPSQCWVLKRTLFLHVRQSHAHQVELHAVQRANQLFNKEALIGYLFILPSLIGFAIFFAYPAVRAVYISFLDWNLLTDAKYVGLENYQTLIDDKRFWDSLRVTALYVLWNI